MTLLTVAPSFLFLSSSGIKTNSILFDSVPPPSFPSWLCLARPLRARRLRLWGARTPSTQLTCSRGALPPATSPFPDPPPLPRRTVAAAATYHKEVVGLPLPLAPLCRLPSFDYLSLARFSAVIG